MGGRGASFGGGGGGGGAFNVQGGFTASGEKQFRRAMSKLSDADFIKQIQRTRQVKRFADRQMRNIVAQNRWRPKSQQFSTESAEKTWMQMRSRERVLRDMLKERRQKRRA